MIHVKTPGEALEDKKREGRGGAITPRKVALREAVRNREDFEEPE